MESMKKPPSQKPSKVLGSPQKPKAEPPKSKDETDQMRAEIGRLLGVTSRRASTGDEVASAILWEMFERIARKLTVLAEQNQAPPIPLLSGVMMRCQKMVQGGLDAKNPAMLEIAFSATEHGCAQLHSAAKRDAKFVTRLAKRVPFWPAMLAQKSQYRNAAHEYLAAISVGTASIPRTSEDTRVELSDPWTRMAVGLFEEIRDGRTLLKMGDSDNDCPGSLVGKIIRGDLAVVQGRYPEIAALPEFGTRKAPAAWWRVAKKRLLLRWNENPAELAAAMKLISAVRAETKKETTVTGIGDHWIWRKNAGHDKSPMTYAIQRVSGAFSTLMKLKKPRKKGT